MPFSFQVDDCLREILKKLAKRDKPLYEATLRKINEIVSRDLQTIDAYKNLKYQLNDYKRVNIDRSFVLLFTVDKKANFILFVKLEHHDMVYK